MADTFKPVAMSEPTAGRTEELLICGLFTDPTGLASVVSILPEEDGMFSESKYGAIYGGMLKMFRDAEAIEPAALATYLVKEKKLKLAGGLDHLEQLADRQRRCNLPVLARELLDVYSRRQQLALCDHLTAQAFDPTTDMIIRSQAIRDGYQDLQRLNVRESAALTKEDYADYYLDLLERRERDRRDGVLYLRFPFPNVHRLVGNLEIGTLIGISGVPGSGKTSFMQQVGEVWSKQGFRGILYHLETAKKTLLDRACSRETGISSKVLRASREDEDRVLTSEEVQSVFAYLERFKARPGDFMYVHSPGWSMSDIIADIHRQHEANPLDFVMVDYLGKIRHVARGRGSYVTFDIGQDLEDYKTTLEKLEIVGFMAAQMDKTREDGTKTKAKNLTLLNVRGTAELEDKSQVGMILVRVRDLTGTLEQDTDLRIVKANDGETGPVKMFYDGPRYSFRERF